MPARSDTPLLRPLPGNSATFVADDDAGTGYRKIYMLMSDSDIFDTGNSLVDCEEWGHKTPSVLVSMNSGSIYLEYELVCQIDHKIKNGEN